MFLRRVNLPHRSAGLFRCTTSLESSKSSRVDTSSLYSRLSAGSVLPTPFILECCTALFRVFGVNSVRSKPFLVPDPTLLASSTASAADFRTLADYVCVAVLREHARSPRPPQEAPFPSPKPQSRHEGYLTGGSRFSPFVTALLEFVTFFAFTGVQHCVLAHIIADAFNDELGPLAVPETAVTAQHRVACPTIMIIRAVVGMVRVRGGCRGGCTSVSRVAAIAADCGVGGTREGGASHAVDLLTQLRRSCCTSGGGEDGGRVDGQAAETMVAPSSPRAALRFPLRPSLRSAAAQHLTSWAAGVQRQSRTVAHEDCSPRRARGGGLLREVLSASASASGHGGEIVDERGEVVPNVVDASSPLSLQRRGLESVQGGVDEAVFRATQWWCLVDSARASPRQDAKWDTMSLIAAATLVVESGVGDVLAAEGVSVELLRSALVSSDGDVEWKYHQAVLRDRGAMTAVAAGLMGVYGGASGTIRAAATLNALRGVGGKVDSASEEGGGGGGRGAVPDCAGSDAMAGAVGACVEAFGWKGASGWGPRSFCEALVHAQANQCGFRHVASLPGQHAWAEVDVANMYAAESQRRTRGVCHLGLV